MSKQKTLYLALFVMLLWGSLYPMVKIGYQVCSVATTGDILLFAGIRFVICGGVICLYCFLKDRRDFLPVKDNILPVLMSGVFAIILHYGFTYIGLNLTDSSKSAILKQIGMLVYVCFSAVFFKDDKITLQKLIGALLGFGGIIAINVTTQGIIFQAGDVLIIAASFCIVFSNVISKAVYEKVDPVVTTGVSQLFGGMVLSIIGVVQGGHIILGFDASMCVLLYMCTASIIAYSIWSIVVKSGQLSKLFIIKFAEPLFASLCAAVMLGENIFKIQYLVAFVLISAGIAISNNILKNCG